MEYTAADTDSLLREGDRCRKQLDLLKKQGLSLDLSREKPSPEQLALSLPILDVLDHRSILDSENGQDCRSYGSLDGIPEARRLLGHMMGTHSARTIISGNSSLSFIYQLISHGMTDGICGGKPWQEVRDRKFLCPVPGCDRHFAITEHFGFELIPIPMGPDGPDMDAVEHWVRDPSVKGIWCMPKYQNPTGAVYSSAVVRRFARLRPAAEDFRIFWDNAYCVHCFDGRCAEIPDILTECERAGSADLVYAFCSTSRITFPGAGISAVAASPANLIDIRSFLRFAVMGPDKLNQLRPVFQRQRRPGGPHEKARRHCKAQIRRGGPDPFRGAGGRGHRRLDQPQGRLFPFLQHPARLRPERYQNVPGIRRDPCAPRRRLPLRPRSRGPEHRGGSRLRLGGGGPPGNPGPVS